MNKPTLKRNRSGAGIQPAQIGAKPSNLVQAELSLQRGECARARELLEHRILHGAEDFYTHNLLGISLAHLGDYDQAGTVFQRLRPQRKAKNQRTKAIFNLGLLQFYQDLEVVGDLSVAKYHRAWPGHLVPRHIPILRWPFQAAIETWQTLLRGRPQHEEIVATYLAFAHLQAGDLDAALTCLIRALSQHENFYITHYVLGRVFLDLFFLAGEGNDFLMTQPTLSFFEIEQDEVAFEARDRFAIHRETFLDIALQAFLEGRSFNPMSVVLLLWLTRTYLLAGLAEEAEDSLHLAETLAPDAAPVLDTLLQFHEAIHSSPEIIKGLVQRIQAARQKQTSMRVEFILPSNYLS